MSLEVRSGHLQARRRLPIGTVGDGPATRSTICGQLDARAQLSWREFDTIEVDFLERYRERRKETGKTFALTSWFFKTVIKLGQVDLDGSSGFCPSVRRRDVPIWSKLAELWFIYFTLKLALALALQHAYDVLDFELNKANSSLMAPPPPPNKQLQAGNGQKLARAIERLDLVGAPYRETKFLTEIVYFFILVIVVFFFAGPRLYLRWKPVNVPVVRFYLDYERELLNVHKDTCRFASSFFMSNKNFLRIRQQLLTVSLSEWFHLRHFDSAKRHNQTNQQRANSRPNVYNNCLEVQQAHNLHMDLKRSLVELARSNRLAALNRTSEWFNSVSALFSALIVAIELIGSLYIGVGFAFAPRLATDSFRLSTNFADVLFLVEIVLYCQLGLQLIAVYGAIVIIICVDQIRFALQLRQLIRATIRKLVESQPKPGQEPGDLTKFADQLNTSLITILIQFKMLNEQLKNTKDVNGFACCISILIMFALPLTCRRYANQLTGDLKLVAAVCSLVVILVTDILIVPSCHLYARCLDLYRSLASLLAHLIAARHFEGPNQISFSASNLHHSQWLLRRELGQPDGMLAKFATSALFIKVNYSSFLAVHFWCGLSIMSLLLADSNWSGSMLTDSLRFL